MATKLMLAVLGSLLAGAVVPAAAACDPTLTPVDKVIGYQDRTGGRCEGLYVSPVSGAPLTLVSLTRGKFSFDPARPADLTVGLAGTGDGPGHVFLRAVGIPAALYYQLDAELTPGHPFVWPLADVVARARLLPSQVGVYAFGRTASGGTVYRPVDVARYGTDPAPGTDYVAVLRQLGSVRTAQWRFHRTGAQPTAWRDVDVIGDRLQVVLSGVGGTAGLLEIRWSEPGIGVSRLRQFDLAL